MDGRHDLSVDHARLLSSAGYSALDSSAVGQQQLRAGYAELCRPPGTDASTLSAYHSRYLASMPLSTGTGFPFLGGMFTGSLPGPPSSPFRTPATPGINNMRFWPPTPPPEGYGRYPMNTSLFPFLGAGSPDSSAFMHQGLVSRHLSPIIDHKEHSFFSHGIGLSSPLTPNSQLTSPSPFPHLLPPLDRHQGYMTHLNKDLEEMDCLIPRQKNAKSEPKILDDCCKIPKSQDNKSSKSNSSASKVQPCKIEVSHSPSLKPDLLSPPIESPKLEGMSPKSAKKSTAATESTTAEARCSQCCASIKDTKKTSAEIVPVFTGSPSSTVTTTTDSTSSVPVVSSTVDTDSLENNKQNDAKSPKSSPVISQPNVESTVPDLSPTKVTSITETIPTKPVTVTPVKHVTAAVLPTAPKQPVHREFHPETTFPSSLQDITKSNLSTPSSHALFAENLGIRPHEVTTTLLPSNKPLYKMPVTNCKVKDMIKPMKQTIPEKPHDMSSTKLPEADSCTKDPLPISPVKSTIPLPGSDANSLTKTVLKEQDHVTQVLKSGQNVVKPATVLKPQENVLSQKQVSWGKATVQPFNWQNSSCPDDQAINLTIDKKVTKTESEKAPSQNVPMTSIKVTESTTGVIGICQPVTKVKATPSVSSISNFSSISVVNQPSEQSTEVHILHRSSKSSFVNRTVTPPVPLKGTVSHSVHKTMKTERFTNKRGKVTDLDKGGRSTLATLAPKLSKTVNFGKEAQIISASSSASSTSIVFPATVNPCIPVGIAIAQQRQDSSAGKSQAAVSVSTPNVVAQNSHLTTARVATDIQAQEFVMDQKSRELCSNNHTPVDTNLLVAQGPTIVSRQWESEALTRTAIPSPWVAHGSIVPTASVWLGQNAYAAASNSVPNVALDTSPISLPPGGYQLARDSITGHLLLIPTANIELMDRQSVWPAFNQATANLPIQQLMTQQQHTQFEQVLPHTDSLKPTEGISCETITTCESRPEGKIEELSGPVGSVPLATGQTYAFTTFPTQCDPQGFSYVLQSSTVMHLQTAATSLQTDSGRRSQGTSPLHCATPTPPPHLSTDAPIIEEEESDSESITCMESTEIRPACPTQSVTMAIQVDMDSQTTSEDEEERKNEIEKVVDDQKVQMSDSANQTECGDSPNHDEPAELKLGEKASEVSTSKSVAKVVPSISIKEDISGTVIVTGETEFAPTLPVESKPVMDFINHHGLNLLVDSIEQFASRTQEDTTGVTLLPVSQTSNSTNAAVQLTPKPTADSSQQNYSNTSPTKTEAEKQFPSQEYKTIDSSCTGGLGLLCALAEQRFFEEAMNEEAKVPKTEDRLESNCSDERERSNSNDSVVSSCSSSPDRSREGTEYDMRLRLAELQRKYKQKQRELEMLRNKNKEISEDDSERSSSPFLEKKSPLKSPKITISKSPLAVQHISPKISIPKRKLSDLGSPEHEGKKKPKLIDKKRNSKEVSTKVDDRKVPSITLVHDTTASHDPKKLDKNSIQMSRNFNSENSSESVSNSSKDENGYDKDKSKIPFFDESAWFVRRSERIFLSDAKPIPALAPEKGNKKNILKISGENHKEKKELKSSKTVKSDEETTPKKRRRFGKSKIISKELVSSDSSVSGSSCDESCDSDSENSDDNTSDSENVPLGKFAGKDHHKQMSLDSTVSGQSEDIPLSVLIGQKNVGCPKLKQCTLTQDDLQENARLLVLDEGLFYAGYVTKSEEPEMYGILIDGERAARPHMFTKEEILNAAVLEVKPTQKEQLIEGSRVCAFWSQQYRCLYPGTVVNKASSPAADPNTVFVEFDDGDSGRIPMNDIRILPSDFPIVSMEPNPFMILGKRRSRAQSQNSCGTNDGKSGNETSDKDKIEMKKRKKDKSGLKTDSEKPKKKRSASSSSEATDDKKHKRRKSDAQEKPKKHKRHKEEHHKHHRKHKRRHHKKHKHEGDMQTPSKDGKPQDTFILENSKSELTVKIKKSPSPHTSHDDVIEKKIVISTGSSGEEKKVKKAKVNASKPAKRKERVPSVEKSKIAAFLPVRQLWRWSGTSYRKPGAKGKARKEFYRAIQRGKETIKVGDCAVFLSTGRPHLPYIGRIETMWESWGGKMDVKVKWFYHPEETKSENKLNQIKGALFQSPHYDENDVQTVSHKCEVLSWSEYHGKSRPENKTTIFDNNDRYFLAGTYDPFLGTLSLEPGVPNMIASTSTVQEHSLK